MEIINSKSGGGEGKMGAEMLCGLWTSSLPPKYYQAIRGLIFFRYQNFPFAHFPLNFHLFIQFSLISLNFNRFEQKFTEKMGRLWASFLFLPFLILLATCTRFPRDGLNGQDVGVNIEWLTDGQLSELGEVEGGQQARMQKLRAFFDAMEPGESKNTAAEKIVAECYSWVEEVAGEEGREELKRLHELGNGKCKEKVAELLAQMDDAEKRGQIEGKLPFCEHVWNRHEHHHHHEEGGGEGEEGGNAEAGGSGGDEQREQNEHHHHRKRWAHRHPRDHFDEDDHEHHSLEEYLQTHLSWLSDAQKDELRGMKDQGKAAIQAKTMEFFEASTGEQRAQAIRQLESGCRELIRRIFGQEKATELRRMREQGATVAQMEAKAREMTDGLEDEGKRARVKEFGPACGRIFAMSGTRKRRDHHEGHGHGAEGHEAHHGGHTLEDYYKTHLSWLTEAQREELKGLKGEGKSRAELQQKVMEWYGQLEGAEKEKAGELLKGGCRELIKALLGEEKAEEVRKMKEAGTEPAKIGQKVDEWIGQLEEGRKKQMALEYAPTCRRLFGVGNGGGSRRRRDHHEGHQGNHGQHSLDDYFRTHLAWLSDGQKEEVKQMKGANKTRGEIQSKVLTWFEATEGETKEKAVELMQGGCRELLKMVLGEEKAAKLKEMRESGTDMDKIKEKIEEWVAELGDERKKGLAAEYKPICAKVFQAKPTGRHLRDHHLEGHEAHHGGHTLEDYYKTHLSWLTEAQREELKGLKGEGKSRAELQQKVMEWYGQLEGAEKEKAGELLKGGCRELIKALLGEEKAEEVRKMKEAGTEPAKIGQKVDEWIGQLEEGRKKQMALEYAPTCRRLFGVGSTDAGPSRMRRSHHHRHRHQNYRQREEEEPTEDDEEVHLDEEDRDEGESSADEHLDRHRSWLSRKQKKVLRGMRQRGHASHEVHDKIHQFYEVSPDEVKATARGILQKGCEAILQRVFGDYKAEEIIQAKEEGMSNAEIDGKIDEALAQIRNPEKRQEAARFAMTCRRIFTMIERRRREVAPAEKTMEELFKSHLSWLTDAQKEELKGMKEAGKGRSEMHQKVMEWFGQLEGEQRGVALEKLRDGCRELLVFVLGKENADELRRMKEAGTGEAELEAKAQQMIGAVEDEGKKAKAKDFGPACKRIFLAN